VAVELLVRLGAIVLLGCHVVVSGRLSSRHRDPVETCESTSRVVLYLFFSALTTACSSHVVILVRSITSPRPMRHTKRFFSHSIWSILGICHCGTDRRPIWVIQDDQCFWVFPYGATGIKTGIFVSGALKPKSHMGY
jgi:hypothetical protein